jgi:hypothetical protein
MNKRAGGSARAHVGAIAWFSIPADVRVTTDDLRALHDEHDLNADNVPIETHGVDAFRRAVRPLKGESYSIRQRGRDHKATLDFGGEESTRTWLQRELTRSIDGELPVVVATLTYNRPRRTAAGNIPGTDSVEYHLVDARLLPGEHEILDDVIRSAYARVRHFKEYLHPNRVRDIVRTAVLGEDAIVMGASQGIYWSPSPKLENIAELVARLGGQMEIVELPDGRRDILARGLNSQIRSDIASIRALINDAVAKNSGAPLSQARQASIRRIYLDMIERAKRLAQIIGATLPPDVVAEVNQLRDDFVDMLASDAPAGRKAREGKV